MARITNLSFYFLLPGFLCGQGGVFDRTVPSEFTVAECYRKSAHKFKSDTIRPNSVMLGQRVWRLISLEPEQNRQILNTNRECLQVGLFEVLKYGIFEKKLNVFSSPYFTEAADTRVSADEVLKLISYSGATSRTSFDENGNASTAVTAFAHGANPP